MELKIFKKIEQSKRQEIINQALGGHYGKVKQLAEQHRASAAAARSELVESIAPSLSYAYQESKPYFDTLSPGCRICGSRPWSTVYINTTCTRECFYCKWKSMVNKDGKISAQGIQFDSIAEYIGFFDAMSYEGLGICGGEPLIEFDKIIELLTGIEQLNKDLYIWLYTNGDLLDEEKCSILSKTRLNEIRFNISASGFDLAHLLTAGKYFKTITVEIPAIPEEMERLFGVLPQLAEIPVSFLNIHQLCVSRHNIRNLLERDYTFLISTNPLSVLESELTALTIMKHIKDKQYNIPVNYCSQVYKERFQSDGQRKFIIGRIIKTYEAVTGAGNIRSISIRLDTEQRECADNHLQATLAGNSENQGKWYFDSGENRLYIHPSLFGLIGHCSSVIRLDYYSYGILSDGIQEKDEKIVDIIDFSRRKIGFTRRKLGSEELNGPQESLYYRKMFLEPLSGEEDKVFCDKDVLKFHYKFHTIKLYEKQGNGFADLY